MEKYTLALTDKSRQNGPYSAIVVLFVGAYNGAYEVHVVLQPQSCCILWFKIILLYFLLTW